MNIKINIATQKIELLESIPFDEVKKFVDAIIAAYGWKYTDVRVKSVTEFVASPAPIIIDRRPYYDPWRPYVTWCQTAVSETSTGLKLGDTVSGNSATFCQT